MYQIHITHFVNPHRFRYKYADTTDKHSHEIELKLEKYVKENGDRVKANKHDRYRFEKIVGVFLARFLESKQKWIRAGIDVADESTDFEDEMIA